MPISFTSVRMSALVVASLACTTAPAHAQPAAPVLDIYGASLTSYKAINAAPVQGLRPQFVQRGVDIDGTSRGLTPFGLALPADPIGGGSTAWRRLGDVDLVTGTYAPTDIDLSFSTLGPPVIIGRTFNSRQVASNGSRIDSNGPMGVNWSQLAQPELVFFDADNNPATLQATDMLYLVYGADRYVEFARTAANSNFFKAKNGAAGVAVIIPSSAGDEIHLTDQRGTKSIFFGFNNSTASGQIWQIMDAAGQTMVVNNAAKNVAIAGYTANGGRIQSITDASGHLYSFTYTWIGGARLSQVAATLAGVPVGTVDYGYYDGVNETANGSAGDLRMVTVSTPTAGGTLVRSKYYRYYTAAWSNSDGRRGRPRAMKMVVGFEGVRGFGAGNLAGATDNALKPYSEAWMEYTSATDDRVSAGFFNGECGCSGGINGSYTFSYSNSSSYASFIGNTTYNTPWATRTIVVQPDGKYQSHLFDEVGQTLARVTTAGNPAGTPGNTWISSLLRDSAGRVTEVRSPAAMGTYVHSTGALTLNSNGTGLITVFGRVASGNLAGLRTSTAVKNGSAGALSTLNAITMVDRRLAVGTSGVSIPNVTSSISYPVAGGTGLTTTIATTFWSGSPSIPGFLVPKSVTVTSPVVSTANNGSGTATVNTRYHRADGSVAFSRDASGIISYSGRDGFGRTIRQIADVNTATTADFILGDNPTAWGITSSGTPIHAVSKMTYDLQDRMLTAESPSVNGTRTAAMAYAVLSDGQLASYSFPLLSGGNYSGPASISISNHAGRPTRSAIIQIPTPTSAVPSATPGANWSRIVDSIYDNSGAKLLASKAYLTTSTSGPADQTTFTYDAMGRKATITDPTGTMRLMAYDDRGLQTQSWTGTSPTNQTLVEVIEYDGGFAGGNGLVTKRIQDADGDWSGTTGDQRVWQMQYDFRNRMIVQTNPVAPHSVEAYDNLDRTTASGQYSSASGLTAASSPFTTAGRVGLVETVYDERGQVARSTLWQINQGTGATVAGAAGSIVTNNWYDASGRVVKTAGSQISKTQYDRLGRAVGRFVIASSTGNAYSDAQSVGAGDTVIEESWTGIDAKTGVPLIQHSVQRNHDAASTGQLSASGPSLTVSGTASNGRVQISAQWYDDYDRPIESVQLGTNGGSSFNRAGAAVPERSDTALRTTTSYDGFGRVYSVVDVQGVEQRTIYDTMGRRIQTIDNYTDGTPGGGAANDQDRIVEYAYSNGLSISVNRKMPSGGDDQLTTYTYGTTKGSGGNQIATGHLLAKITYPEQVSGQSIPDRSMSYAYNALGQVISTTDPAGNVINTTYDNGGRSVARDVATFAAGFDQRVKKIQTSYTNRGQLATARQQNSSGGMLDEISMLYDNWGNPAWMYQDPVGRDGFETSWAWSKNTTPNAWQGMLLDQVLQPGGMILNVLRNSGLDASLGRTSRIEDGNGSPLASYEYLGVGTVVSTALNEPNVKSGLYSGTSASYGTYLDQFNRVLKSQWSRGPAVFVDFTVTAYNRYGQPLAVKDAVLASGPGVSTPPIPTLRQFDALMTYDALRRVSSKLEGELASGNTAIGTLTRQQLMQRSLAGVATVDQVDLNGNSVFTDPPPESENGEMDDTRVFNKRNELRSRTVLDSSNPAGITYTLTYDKNGNLTSDGQKYNYVYNPFGQLVQVNVINKTPVVVAAKYTYNALGHRNTEQTDTNDSSNTGAADGVVDASDPVFFIATDLAGRRVATYRGNDNYPKEEFAYHMPAGSGTAGAAGPILRTRGGLPSNPASWATAEGTEFHTERFFYTSDFRGNVSAIVSSGGNLIEQYRYSATGVPFGIPHGDVNADGLVGTPAGGGGGGGGGTLSAFAIAAGNADYDQAVYLAANNIYEVRADWNLDGVIDAADTAATSTAVGTAAGRKAMSAAGVGNRIAGEGTAELYDSAVVDIRGRVVSTKLQIVLNTSEYSETLVVMTTSDYSETYENDEFATDITSQADKTNPCPGGVIVFDPRMGGGGRCRCVSTGRLIKCPAGVGPPKNPPKNPPKKKEPKIPVQTFVEVVKCGKKYDNCLKKAQADYESYLKSCGRLKPEEQKKCHGEADRLYGLDVSSCTAEYLVCSLEELLPF